MNSPDHISKSLETIFWLKYLNSLIQIRDPGWKTFGSGMKKNSDPGSPGFGSGIRIRDEQPESYISKSLETIFWVKILQFFDSDSVSGMEKSSDPGSPGSATRLF
jgi:hypothetical protein